MSLLAASRPDLAAPRRIAVARAFVPKPEPRNPSSAYCAQGGPDSVASTYIAGARPLFVKP
jgi:hypothetical protein